MRKVYLLFIASAFVFSNILLSQSFVLSGEENVSDINLLASEMELAEFLELGKDKEAEELVDNVLAKIPASEIESNVKSLDFIVLCGLVKTVRGELDRAEELFRQALALSRNEFGPESIELAKTLQSFAKLCVERNNLKDAAKAAQEANRILGNSEGVNPLDLVVAKNNLTYISFLNGQHEDAVKELEATFSCLQKLGPEFDSIKGIFELLIQTNLGTNLFFLREIEESRKNLEEVFLKLARNENEF